jgi:hypothetical protein
MTDILSREAAMTRISIMEDAWAATKDVDDGLRQAHMEIYIFGKYSPDELSVFPNGISRYAGCICDERIFEGDSPDDEDRAEENVTNEW